MTMPVALIAIAGLMTAVIPADRRDIVIESDRAKRSVKN
jgi:hypothetical protein